MGPLKGVRVLELAGLGPGPFCAMMLSDMGAEVVRIDRPPGTASPRVPPEFDYLVRGRRSLAIDLKTEDGVETLLRMAGEADVLIEVYRPGVAERLGFGPETCQARNPRLIYGRMTGWGQSGPLAAAAGHDINYIAVSGVLDLIGPAGGKPVPPLNIVADYGGGGMMMAFALAAALFERESSGQGQVIDAAMIDGAALMANSVLGLQAGGMWPGGRGSNLLDGGAPFYDTYETADGGWLAVGALEPKFYEALLGVLGVDKSEFEPQYDQTRWPGYRSRFEELFRARPRRDWEQAFDGIDACVTPVLTLEEARSHPHMKKRKVFGAVEDTVQAAPAPRFSRTPGAARSTSPAPGEHTGAVLADWGFSAAEIGDLHAKGAVASK